MGTHPDRKILFVVFANVGGGFLLSSGSCHRDTHLVAVIRCRRQQCRIHKTAEKKEKAQVHSWLRGHAAGESGQPASFTNFQEKVSRVVTTRDRPVLGSFGGGNGYDATRFIYSRGSPQKAFHLSQQATHHGPSHNHHNQPVTILKFFPAR